MSSDSDAAASAMLISETQTARIVISCGMAAFAMLVYEWIVTFDREVHLVWKRKFTAATLLFVMNRYSMFFQYAVNIPSINPMSNLSCQVLGYFFYVFSATPYVVWAAFSSLRAYALCERNWRIALPVFLLSVEPAGTLIYHYTNYVSFVLPPPLNCTFADNTDPVLAKRLVILDSVCLIVADVIVLAVTWIKTYEVARTAVLGSARPTLSSLMLRDGTTYFTIITILNIMNMVANLRAEIAYLTLFVEPVTSILISRFLLNLREVGLPDETSTTEVTSKTPGRSPPRNQLATLKFVRSFIDSLGASLESPFRSSEGSDMFATSEEFDVHSADTSGKRPEEVDEVFLDWIRINRALEGQTADPSRLEIGVAGTPNASALHIQEEPRSSRLL